MNSQSAIPMTMATSAINAMERPQSRAYRQAWRQEPVTQKPASGMTASMATK